MDRAQKSEQVAALKQTFNETSVVVVTRNLGMTVAQSTALRIRMRDAGASYKVTKNTLTLIALEGTTYAPIGNLLTGPTALATSSDPVAAAKVAVDFAKTTDRFEIVGGAMGDTVLDVAGVGRLPSFRRLMICVPRSSALSRRRRRRLRGPISEPGAMLARVLGLMPPKRNA
jgi:large subunit ribosomal protein L10